MDMPEGWKRLINIIETTKVSYKDPKHKACSELSEYIIKSIWQDPLNIMKEMAEALEDMVQACNQGYGRDIKKMERALNKFKEWK